MSFPPPSSSSLVFSRLPCWRRPCWRRPWSSTPAAQHADPHRGNRPNGLCPGGGDSSRRVPLTIASHDPTTERENQATLLILGVGGVEGKCLAPTPGPATSPLNWSSQPGTWRASHRSRRQAASTTIWRSPAAGTDVVVTPASPPSNPGRLRPTRPTGTVVTIAPLRGDGCVMRRRVRRTSKD